MALSLFMPSTTGMEAQSHALSQVATNIANINTVGYKTNETMFYSLLGSNPVVKSTNTGLTSSRTDIQGVGYYDRTNVLDSGVVVSTGNNYDVAISGNDNAFFTLKDDYNNIYYTRAGNFSVQTENGVTYLVNGNGLNVQGFLSVDGKDVYGVAAEDIIIQYPEKIPPIPTTELTITANVPATGVDSSSYSMTVYAPTHDGETMNMILKKVEGKANTWELSFSVNGGTATSEATEVVFSDKGDLETPKVLDVNINWDDGDTNSVHLDISNMTQLAGGQGTTYIKQDGAPSGQFEKCFIDKDGVVKAYYSNGDTYNCGKLALTSFTAPENLTPINGTLFEANAETGETAYVSDTSILVPQALEQSAVNVEEEFSNMIVVQRAYSLNTQSFTAANEMLQTLVDLKT